MLQRNVASTISNYTYAMPCIKNLFILVSKSFPLAVYIDYRATKVLDVDYESMPMVRQLNTLCLSTQTFHKFYNGYEQ